MWRTVKHQERLFKRLISGRDPDVKHLALTMPFIVCLFPEQTLSPQAKGLFHRAIFQSGVALLGVSSGRPLNHAKVLYGKC